MKDAGRKNSGYPIAGQSWYMEDIRSVNLLLETPEMEEWIAEGLSFYDPACGWGTIPRTLAEDGRIDVRRIHGTDLVDRKEWAWPGMIETLDFLTATDDDMLNLGIDPWRTVLICNPPFDKAKGTCRFIEKGLDLGFRHIAIFSSQDLLFSQWRISLWHRWPVAKICFLSERPSCPPGEGLMSGEIEAKGGSKDYIWVLFSQGVAPMDGVMWLGDPKPVRI